MKTLITILCVLTVAAGIFLSARFAGHSWHADIPRSDTLRQQEYREAQPETYQVAFVAPSELITCQEPTPSRASRPLKSPPPAAFAKNQQFGSSKTQQSVPKLNTPQSGFASLPVNKNSPKTLKTSFGPITSRPEFASNKPQFQQPSNAKPSSFGSSRQVTFAVPSSSLSTNAPWPANAKNVKSLVRTQYSLPSGAAESIVKFFSADGNESIETKINTDEQRHLVSLQVTTDEATQRAIANFLAAVYPQTRLDEIQKDSAADEPVLLGDVSPVDETGEPEVLPDAGEVPSPVELELPEISDTEIN